MPAPPTKAEVKLSEDLQYRKQEIETRAEQVDSQDYFAMLGLDHKASASDVQTAYFKVAKAWHPDRLPAELAEMKPLVSKVFAKYNEAFAVLNDPPKRAEYLKTVEAGGGTGEEDEQVRRVVDAAFEFQKAEIYLKKNDISNAEQSAKSAAAADEDQVEYLALYVWIQAVKRGDPPVVPEGKTTAFYDDLISQLDMVIKKQPNLERALSYRATLLKRSGRDEKALRDFRQVVSINPKNIDALRELRLFQMRKDKKGKDDGLLGKLFKK
jgi:curved DNA-binding protein CbpA